MKLRTLRWLGLLLAEAGWLTGPQPAAAEEMLTFTSFHEPVDRVGRDRPLALSVAVNEPAQVAYVVLHFRKLTGGDSMADAAKGRRFANQYFDPAPESPGTYRLELPASKVGNHGLEYYISLVDVKGELHVLFASAGLPHRVGVESDSAPTAAIAVPASESAAAPTAAAAPAAGTPAVASKAFSALREEFELMEAEDTGEVVVTASRRAQKIETAPTAVSVLTAEDIRESGATSIAEVLRLAAGVHVIMINQTNHNVSIRGFNGQNPNKILVYIDGRSVYLDPLGLTFMEAMPIHINDIQRIEVIRGPVSALYGPNAINGLVNIITKTPEQSEKARAEVEMGELGYTSLYASAANQGDRFGVRLAANLLNHNDWNNVPDGPFFEDRFRVSSEDDRPTDEVGERVNGRLLYKIGDDGAASLSAGTVKGNLQIDSALGDIRAKGLVSHVEGDVDVGGFHSQAYYNRVDLDADIDTFLVDVEDPAIAAILYAPLELKNSWGSAFDAEATYTFEIGEQLNWLIGGNYRNIRLTSARLDRRTLVEDWGAGFTQMEWQATPDILFNLAGRLDQHPITDTTFSPRGSAIFSLSEDHHVRLGAGQAFRSPTMLDSSVDITLAELAGERIGQDGNPNIEAEVTTSLEAGYIGRLGESFRVNIDGYYSTTDDAGVGIDNKNLMQLIAAGGGVNGAEGEDPNRNQIISSGVEVAAHWDLAEWLSLAANWSYVDVEVRKEEPFCDPDLARAAGGRCEEEGAYDPEFDPVKDEGDKLLETPNHLMNVKATLKRSGLTLSAWVQAASRSEIRTTNTVFNLYSQATVDRELSPAEATRFAYRPVHLDGYANLNLLASYLLIEDPELEIGAGALNVTNNRHQEYPGYRMHLTGLTGQPTGRLFESGGRESGRLVYGYLGVKW